MCLPFVLFAHVLVFNRLLLLICKNTFLFSILHLAVDHGREQLVNQVLQLMEQVHSTGLIDSRDASGWVSYL